MRALIVLFTLFAATAQAAELTLDRAPIQGGLVIGTAAPGAQVWFEDRPLRLDRDGRFAFGFGRDAPPTASLRVVWPGGREEVRTLRVEQRTYREQRIDGLPPRQVTPPQAVLDRIRGDSRAAGAARRYDTPETWFLDGFLWPATGRITGVYGSRRVLNGEPRRPHYGIDIAAPTGTPVKAPASGIIRLVRDMYYSGWTLVMDHGHGVSSTFLHMDRVDVAEGDFVPQGGVLGAVGSTGRSTGPHLDWRANWFAERLDVSLMAGPMPGG